jgi:hypothetical protein
MSKVDGLICPRCGSADLELGRADVNGESADETTVQRCCQCGERLRTEGRRSCVVERKCDRTRLERPPSLAAARE